MSGQTASNGFIWKSLEQYSVIVIQFILQIILARIIEPSAYGIVAIVNVFISFSNVIIHSGFSVALVREKKIDREDIDSVFNCSLSVAVLIYIVIYFTSPLIAKYYHLSVLSPLLRILGLGIFLHILSSIQIALFMRKLKFKSMFYATLISIVVSGVISIFLALNGWGVWSLAAHQILSAIISIIVLYHKEKWFPHLYINFKRINKLISFGWKVFLTNIVDELFANIRTLVIGKKFNSATLSYFNRGRSLPDLLVKSINGSLQAVLLPVLSSNQEKKDVIKAVLKKTITISCFVLFPLLTILATCGENIIMLLLGKKWLPATFFLQVCCIYFATWPLITSNTQALYATGHSETVLKIESIRKSIDILILIATIPLGIKAITYGMALVSILSVPLYLSQTNKICGYSALQQYKDIVGAVLLSIGTGLCVMLINNLKINYIGLLLIKIVVGLTFYIGGAHMIKMQALHMTIEYARSIIGRK